jgi:quercetin dioxygenase-like cupin family protein
VFAYVLEGALISQTEGQPVATYRAGQIFYEPANGIHAVSRNASASAPVKLLVFYLGEPDKPVTVPVD